jgi:SAM-dependent methyltransferase
MLITTAHARACSRTLHTLLTTHLAADPNPYLASHAQPGTLAHHVNVVCWYLPYLPASGSVLEWGCFHGPDSCILRNLTGDRFDLHACDHVSADAFRSFRDYARPAYRELRHAWQLPYPDGQFDAVIGSGVLEHVAMDYESLKELYRVLKPDGTLVITYLPHAGSAQEWYNRTVRKSGHRRLYDRRGLDRMLRSTGFVPEVITYQTFVPDVYNGRGRPWWKRLLRPVLYPTPRHDVICAVAHKTLMM